MKPADLARLHAAAFTRERPWAAAEFAALLENRHTALLTRPHGFALTRTVAGESELLTLAVDPAHQRQGI
ncbi:MAG: ribosomal-protein-alanine acetyltransferase, partial [Sulfitobacter sp.]|nr:ribosomal-protein-alanine acetyltransferase [Sulfitobacter sp.]